MDSFFIVFVSFLLRTVEVFIFKRESKYTVYTRGTFQPSRAVWEEFAAVVKLNINESNAHRRLTNVDELKTNQTNHVAVILSCFPLIYVGTFRNQYSWLWSLLSHTKSRSGSRHW